MRQKHGITYNPEQPLALSIQQPWAWLIAHGYKDIENRSWSTQYRGPFLIHAGKKIDTHGYAWVRDNFPSIPLPSLDAFETGGIVGVATLTDCHLPGSQLVSPWYTGQYGFAVCDGRPLPFRACRGKLKFFNPK